MILKRSNVEKIILDESVAKAMLSKGWVDVSPQEEQPKPKRTRKKSEDAE